jgi:hypothetical protein
MASAEHLLHEAQYAFASISFGETPANRRHAARAKSLCKKIIRKYPTSMQASEARAILRRLGEEAYTSELLVQHRHMTQTSHHVRSDTYETPAVVPAAGDSPVFDWGGLLAVLLMTQKLLLGVFAVVGFVLFSLFGPFLLAALIFLVILTGPFRSLLNRAQRDRVDEFIVRANAFIEERRRSGTGFG